MLNKFKLTYKIHRTKKQTLMLFSAQLICLLIGFFSNIFLAKEMGDYYFGLYSFAIAVITFIAIFFEFGFFSSISRLLATNNNIEQEKELIGISIIILGLIILLFIIVIFGISYIIDDYLDDKIGNLLFLTSFFSWSFTIPYYLELVLKGCNRIEYLSLFNLTWKLLFGLYLIYFYCFFRVIPLNTLFALSITSIIPFLYILIRFNPSFTSIKTNFLKVYEEYQSFGYHIYIGRIASVSTYNLDKLLIGYLLGAKDVGYYSLANSMASPITIFSVSLSHSNFKSFSNRNPISSSIIKTNIKWILFAFICSNFLGLIIVLYLGNNYYDVLLLLFIMSIALSIQANDQPYNAWLNCNGFGNEMKKLCVTSGIINTILNILLIVLFDTIGAALACLLSRAYIYISCYRLYLTKK